MSSFNYLTIFKLDFFIYSNYPFLGKKRMLIPEIVSRYSVQTYPSILINLKDIDKR